MLVSASVHILKTRDQASDAAAWLGMVWLVPGLGLLLYFLFGINRIRRSAVKARIKRGLKIDVQDALPPSMADLALPQTTPNRWAAHAFLGTRVSRQPLYNGNRIKMLSTGRDAYDAMIEAIENSQTSITLTTYIFQTDQAGRRFVKALTDARRRDVEVRVLVDAVGNLYGLKPVSPILKRRGIKVAAFNPLRFGWRLAFFNLRTHRKILVVDGQIGFAGGMNIRKGHLQTKRKKGPIIDRHFKIEGPVVSAMMDAFADDWLYATGEDLRGPIWYPNLMNMGPLTVRAVADGPDRIRHQTQSIMMSAVTSASTSIIVATPYFLPDAKLKTALEQSAMRGVCVTILLPMESNLPLFDLVAKAGLLSMIDSGVLIKQVPAPFDHSKLMVVDGLWTLIGSSNWDARSLKLNFEFNLESFGAAFAKTLTEDLKIKEAKSVLLTPEALMSRPLYKRVIGKILWLLSPYL